MSHVFRFGSGVSTLDGWGVTSQYDRKNISAIQDPSGGNADLPITSVPTPFASFELVRNAFEQCGKSVNDVDGKSIYHKLVSHALDVMEIFFNFKKHTEDFNIIPWNVSTDLQRLKDGKLAHERLWATLDLYLNQDKDSFNFVSGNNADKIDLCIYMLDYKKGPKPINIVGGTSPTSLCIGSTNALDFVDITLSNNHHAFTNDQDSYLSLYKRDPNFFKYLWEISLHPDFSTTFKEVHKYIQMCYEACTDAKVKEELKSKTFSDYNSDFDQLCIGSQRLYLAGGIPINQMISNDISERSAFRIKATKNVSVCPLVLPYQIYNEPDMIYTTGCWDCKNCAPLRDEMPIDKRHLPFDGSQYPYLTVDDVFEPYLIKTMYPIDGKSFFNCNFENKEYGFLLPLKTEVFKYFSINDICGNIDERHSMFSITELAGGSAKATFNIPIQNNKFITFERIYFGGDTIIEPDVDNNKGCIDECKFDLFLFPSFHFDNPAVSHPQYVYLIEEDIKSLTIHNHYSCSVFKDDTNEELESDEIGRADKNAGNTFSSAYYVLNKEFEYIQISNGHAEAIAIPKYKKIINGANEFEFAIDFGTTNTHIEYKENGQIKPFTITSQDLQLLSLHDDSANELIKKLDLQSFTDAPLQEFLPTVLGKDEICNFPIRTNLSELKSSNRGSRKTIPICDYTIGFHYEKKQTYLHNKCITGLKWQNGNDNLIDAYFTELLLLIRNKVILNGGDLSKTKIVWFHPISMAVYQHSVLKKKWDDLCKNFIDGRCMPSDVTESVAPYYYYKNTQGVNSADRPVVSMDIGGGTSDFVIYIDNKPQWISSVRYAGDNIYGDFLGMNMSNNGFYLRYKDKIERVLNGTEVQKLYDEIKANGKSSDYISFLFSLEKNPDLKKVDLSFSKILNEDVEMKIVLLLFYVSELYYIANYMKQKGLGSPAFITLSGSGSKAINLIGAKSELEKLATIIFNDVIGDKEKVCLKQVDNPKEITCKGGLDMRDSDTDIDVSELKFNFNGSSSLDRLDTSSYDDVDNVVKNDVISFYNDFINYFFALNAKLSFADYFGIDTQKSFSKYKEVLMEKASQDFSTVLSSRRENLAGQDHPDLNDSLFFFPLTGGINRLAYYIATSETK
jgi:hypothetical protein